jgi:hypothetical protein
VPQPIIRDRATKEAEARARHIRYGVGALVAIALAAVLVPNCTSQRRRGPERLPPAPKLVHFRVTPPNAMALSIVLVDDEGAQQVVPNDQPVDLELAGEVQWSVTSPGHRGEHGKFEVPYGETQQAYVVDVTLKPSKQTRPRRNLSGFGRISAGGRR